MLSPDEIAATPSGADLIGEGAPDRGCREPAADRVAGLLASRLARATAVVDADGRAGRAAIVPGPLPRRRDGAGPGRNVGGGPLGNGSVETARPPANVGRRAVEQ